MGLYCNIDARTFDSSAHLGAHGVWTKLESYPASRSRPFTTRSPAKRWVYNRNSPKVKASTMSASLTSLSSPRVRGTLKRQPFDFDALFTDLAQNSFPVPRALG